MAQVLASTDGSEADADLLARTVGLLGRDHEFIVLRRVESGLQLRIQLAHAQQATVHRRQHLHVAERIALQLSGNPSAYDLEQGAKNLLRRQPGEFSAMLDAGPGQF